MSKKLIAPAIWEYSYNDEGLSEAKKDAEYYANGAGKMVWANRGTRYVLSSDIQGLRYYGPLGEHWKTDRLWHGCVEIYKVEPEAQ